MAKPKPMRLTDAELMVMANMIKAHVENDITGPLLVPMALKVGAEQIRRKQLRDENTKGKS